MGLRVRWSWGSDGVGGQMRLRGQMGVEGQMELKGSDGSGGRWSWGQMELGVRWSWGDQIELGGQMNLGVDGVEVR